jgi:hypothetical protein
MIKISLELQPSHSETSDAQIDQWLLGGAEGLFFQRVLICLQNALLDELVRLGSMLYFLLQRVGSHAFLQRFLVGL